MDTRVQFPDPGGYKDWHDWAHEINTVLTRMLQVTPEEQYPIIVLKEVQPAGVHGGTFTAGAWYTRTINTEYDPVGICLLSGNTFQIPKGRYFIRGSAPGRGVESHQLRLFNITDNRVEVYGTSEYSPTGLAQIRSWLQAVIEPKRATTYRFEHRCQTTRATDGLGVASSWDGPETYTQVELWGLT